METELASAAKFMEMYGVGGIGTIALAAAFMYVLAKYLPSRDAEAKAIHEKYAQAMTEQATQYRALNESLTAKFLDALDRQRNTLINRKEDK